MNMDSVWAAVLHHESKELKIGYYWFVHCDFAKKVCTLQVNCLFRITIINKNLKIKNQDERIELQKKRKNSTSSLDIRLLKQKKHGRST